MLFNFPPNSGATGTAAYLSVFESLHHTLGALQAMPATASMFRPTSTPCATRILEGNAKRFGTDANVAVRI